MKNKKEEMYDGLAIAYFVIFLFVGLLTFSVGFFVKDLWPFMLLSLMPFATSAFFWARRFETHYD